MLKPPINELIDITGSRYALVICVSKRARQIIDGDDILVKAKIIKPVSVATQELYDGKIECVKPEEDLL